MPWRGMLRIISSFLASGTSIEALQLKIVSIKLDIGLGTSRIEENSLTSFKRDAAIEDALTQIVERGRAPSVKIGLYSWAPTGTYDSEFAFVPAASRIREVFPTLDRLGYLKVSDAH